MNADNDRQIRAWLEARDPGAAPARLRAAAAEVPFARRGPRLPGLDYMRVRLFGLHLTVRPLAVALLVVALVAAIIGAGLLVRWLQFPPRGLIAYTVPVEAYGSTAVMLASTDGSVRRQISGTAANVYSHSPRWSRDGRTILFARTTELDPLNSCLGVGEVVLYDVAAGVERVIASGLRPINVLEWSPDGDRAAYTYPPPGCGASVELGVVDLRTGQVTTTSVLPPVVSETSPNPGPVLFHVHWAGDVPTAIPEAIVTDDERDFTTTVDIPSHDGRSRVRYAWTTPERIPRLEALDGTSGASIDLGPGGQPSWSPDDTAVAYIQPGGPGGPDAVDYMRDHLVIVSVDTWQPRQVADVLVIDGPPADLIPRVSWTPDGTAIYWIDPGGLHVVDVASGRRADLTAIPDSCTDPQWQPLPGG